MALTNITFQALEACFEDTDFRREIWDYLKSTKPESITDREALSIIRIALKDPDYFEMAVELQKIDYRDLFMAAEHGQLESHMDWAASVIAKPPKSKQEREEMVQDPLHFFTEEEIIEECLHIIHKRRILADVKRGVYAFVGLKIEVDKKTLYKNKIPTARVVLVMGARRMAKIKIK
jgi:hypothetical protein